MAPKAPGRTALRATAGGEAATLIPEVVRLAGEHHVLGWVRDDERSPLALHAEGDPAALAAFIEAVSGVTDGLASQSVRAEGHEQFAVRGVAAGVFVVQEHAATAHHFDFRLQVGEVMRSWAVPKGPSLDPAVKRMALEVEDHSLGHNDFEGRAGRGAVIVWDRGTYEQGGRVPWPQALERGHAVFVLHGEKLRGGFALQRTSKGDKPQWLLIKRRDEHAQSGSDVTAAQPGSVLSGRTLDELLEHE